MDSATAVRLLAEQNSPLKQLAGFQKHHRVPTTASAGDQRFICDLAEPQIDADLQTTFSALRKSYGLKRKEISVDGPADGGGVITTPFFNYEIQICQNEDEPSKVIWTRAITEMSEPARVFAGPFEEIFGKQFSVLEILTEEPLELEAIVDHIEDLEVETVKIDYDKDLTWCELEVQNSLTSVWLSDQSIRVVSHREITPQELLEAFLDIHHRFIETLNLSGIPFLNSSN
ncbi:MAG: hypothetical protein P8J27_04570 [Mariniblastus sp.]|nr:hypothetical protein [Mariniblastus sp.]